MSGIGRDGQDLVLVAVERIGIEPEFFVPESLVEPSEQSSGLGPQFRGTLGLAENIENLCHTEPSIVDVALKLAERLGPLYQRAIRIHDRIARILPAHVLVASRRACLIFLESVPVAVAVFIDPGETAFRRLQMLLQELLVTGRTPGRVQCYQIKRCRIRGPVIRCVWDQLEMRKLAVTQLVEDLSRFGIAIWIVLLGLQPPKISNAPRANSG